MILRSDSLNYFRLKTKCDSWRIKGAIVMSVSESSAGGLKSEVNNFLSEVLHIYTEIREAGNSYE